MKMVCKYCQGRGFFQRESASSNYLLKWRCDMCHGTGLTPEVPEPDFTLDDLEWSEEYE